MHSLSNYCSIIAGTERSGPNRSQRADGGGAHAAVPVTPYALHAVHALHAVFEVAA